MKGVDQFEQWLPDVLIGMLQQGADVPAGDVARAVGLAVATTGFIVVVRLGLRVLGALKNLFAGHQMVERAPGGLAILRKLSGFAAFALPWYNLIHLASDGELTAEMANFPILVAT
ncbi:MAG: hypothetical protein KC502_17960, partial [Myxococcales bacterium]|nr:hypothetical protein [Myxococcales bacterium]